VPPEVLPLVGVKPVMVGGATYVNPVALAVVPPRVVTVTVLGPTVPGGTVTVIDVAPVLVTAAAFPPTVTVAPVRCVPVMTTPAKPVSGPSLGVTAVMVGGAT